MFSIKARNSTVRSKWQMCVPSGIVLLVFWFTGILFFICMILYSWASDQQYAIPWFSLFIIACFWVIIYTTPRMMCYFRLHQNHIEYVVPFKKRFVLEYKNCTVGIDYSYRQSDKVYWIYFCIGDFPKYDPKQPRNRINAFKCDSSFIRMLYSEDIYNQLLTVLPKKQRTALISSQRFIEDR